jgi:hypothetical protein
MNERFLPNTRLGKLDHLAEECAEVILAIAKLKRFGPGPNVVDGVEFPDNIERLHEEMRDLEHAISKVRCCDLTRIVFGSIEIEDGPDVGHDVPGGGANP